MRGFSDEEREQIRERLIAEGRTLFAQYGLEKTNISELTEPVGIATSTFYRFFDSKEDLYVEILEREGDQFRQRLRAELDEAGDTRASVVTLLRVVIEEIETNPLVHAIVVNEEVDRLATRHEGGYEEGRESAFAYLLPLVEEWIENGQMRADVDPEVVASTLRVVTMVPLQREAIGAERYAETRDLLVELVADGLVDDHQ